VKDLQDLLDQLAPQVSEVRRVRPAPSGPLVDRAPRVHPVTLERRESLERKVPSGRRVVTESRVQ